MTKDEEVFQSKLKYLEFIETTISRMNASSSSIKQWTCLIVTAFITCYCHESKKCFFLFASGISLIMSFLDANYLRCERKYRKLYNDAAGITEKKQEFILFDMSTKRYEANPCTLLGAFLSWSVSGFYLSLVILLLSAYFIL